MQDNVVVSVADLAAHLGDPNWLPVDCRFRLTEPEAGEAMYRQAHIPGAVYAHVDRDLSGPVVPGLTGRHPLPTPEAMAATLGRWGVTSATRVVAYDDAGGAFAARLWWLCVWLGHGRPAVLNGGWQAWQAAALPTTDAPTLRPAAPPTPSPPVRADRVVGANEVAALARTPNQVFDSRTAARFRGEGETIDPVAGHVPGAVSAPYPDNLGPDGLFLPPADLARLFTERLGTTPPDAAVFYCGSGVTAAHNLLAMVHAGLPLARLYAGSWSEWITDPARPVATTEEDDR